MNSQPTQAARPVPVRDFVGKFFLLGLYALAGYVPSTGSRPERSRQGVAVNRLLLKNGGKNKTGTIRQIFCVPKRGPDIDLGAWKAAEKWGKNGFPAPEILTAMINSQTGSDHTFLEWDEQQDGRYDTRSFASRRTQKSAEPNVPLVPLSFSDWCPVLKSFVKPRTICTWLGIPRLNDNNIAVIQGTPSKLQDSLQTRPFYQFFAGSVVTHNGYPTASLERTTLSNRNSKGCDRMDVPDSISASPDDPRVTDVEPDILFKVARMFGFGCVLASNDDLSTFDNKVKKADKPLRAAAWHAFAGKQIKDGDTYYGSSLADFSEAYAALVQSVITEEEDLGEGDEKDDIFGEFYTETPRAEQGSTNTHTAERNDNGPPQGGGNLVLRTLYDEVKLPDSYPGVLEIGTAQGNPLLFNYSPHIVDDHAEVFIFPVTLLKITACDIPDYGIQFDGSSWKSGKVTASDGSDVTFQPLGHNRIKLTRSVDQPWANLEGSFQFLLEIGVVSYADTDAEFEVELYAPATNNMRLYNQSDRPDPEEVIRIALEAFKMRGDVNDRGQITLNKLRIRVDSGTTDNAAEGDSE